MPGMRLHRERDVVEHREVEKERGDLERAGEPEMAAPPRRQARDVGAGEADAAGIGRQLAAELGDERGLAGAVRADDGVQFAFRDLEHEVVGGDDAAEALGELVDLQQRAHAGAFLRCGQRAAASRPSMPPRANRTISSSSGQRMICQYSVMPESTSSSTSSATAPNTGPAAEPMPPSTTMTMRSPERVQYMVAGLMNSLWLASSAPASPPSVPAMTKQTSL